MSTGNGYLYLVARAVDVLACTWFWRQVDVTVSSMIGLEMRGLQPRLYARVLNWILDKIQKGHCELAIAADKQRALDALALLNSIPPKE